MSTARPAAPAAKHYHVPAKDREYLIANLALLLRAAVPVGEALASLGETATSRPFRQALKQMESDVAEGFPLWRALERSRLLGAQALSLIRLGEESGNLVMNLSIAAKQEEKQRLLRAKVRSALLYPAFVLGVTVLVGLGVAWFLLPKLALTFQQLNVHLPLISRIFIGFGTFLKADGWWAVPGGVAGLAGLIYLAFVAPPTRWLGQAVLLRLPGTGRLVREIEVARFGHLFGSLLAAGLSVTQAWQLLEEASGVPAYQRFYQHMAAAFDEGFGFRGSLHRYKSANQVLPPTVQQMIIAAERSGTLPDTLRDIGQIYEQKADITTQNLEVILEPVLLVFVWLGVMAVAIAVILPIYSLVGGLS